jgi:hypothetical protein
MTNTSHRLALSRVSVVLAILLLNVTLAAACHSQSAPSNAANMIRGTWVIKSIYPTQNVQGPNLSQQKKLVGTKIVLDAQTLKACGQSVPISSVDVHQVNAADFLTNTRVRFSEVGINKPSIAEVVINNREAGICFEVFPLPGQDIYINGKDEVVIDFEGVFYRAVRKEQ